MARKSKIITTVEAARKRGTPRLKAVAQALGLPGPQKPSYKPRARGR